MESRDDCWTGQSVSSMGALLHCACCSCRLLQRSPSISPHFEAVPTVQCGDGVVLLFSGSLTPWPP